MPKYEVLMPFVALVEAESVDEAADKAVRTVDLAVSQPSIAGKFRVAYEFISKTDGLSIREIPE